MALRPLLLKMERRANKEFKASLVQKEIKAIKVIKATPDSPVPAMF